MKRLIPVAVVVLMFALAMAGARAEGDAGADQVLGHWFTDKEEAKVEITKKDGKFFGKLIWLSEPKYPADDPEAGVEKHDRENPDAKLKSRPVLGLEILKEFSYAGENLWQNGTIYDPESGKTYKCKMWIDEKDKLKVKGYVGVSVLGRTTIWTRAPKEEKPAAPAPSE
jgi:uncharacterized protein (DUF2147 family)